MLALQAMISGARFLKFRCTGCGNCCRDPLLPVTDGDLVRISSGTNEDPSKMIRWVSRQDIDLKGLPELFVKLPQGRRVMVLRQNRAGCHFLESDACSVYEHRPLGCRIFPFSPTVSKKGSLRRLKLLDSSECLYELDGKNEPSDICALSSAFDAEWRAYCKKIELWNGSQRRRVRKGLAAQSGRSFLRFLGAVP